MRVKVTKSVVRDKETGELLPDAERSYQFEIQVPQVDLCFTTPWFCGTPTQIEERLSRLRQALVEYVGKDDPEKVIEEREVSYGDEAGEVRSKQGKAGGASRRGNKGSGKGSASSGPGIKAGRKAEGRGKGSGAGASDGSQGSLKGMEK